MTLEPQPEQSLSLYDAALSYARRGWKVFPVRGKLPLVMWQDEATLDEAEIKDWFDDADPEIGVAIVTGTGLVVLDVDAKSGGLESLSALLTEYAGRVVDTSVVRTGGGGLHFYFRTEVELRNKTGVRPGIDIRGDGGYVVAPPSPHQSGNRYQWEIEEDELSPWPFDLHKSAPAEPVDEGEGVLTGTRNATLTSLAGSMRRRGMGQLAIRAALLEENKVLCNPPLPEKEVIAIAKSVSRYEPGDPVDVDTEAVAITATEFMAQTVENTEYLVTGMWPDSAIGFIVGPPKSFKSFFTLELAFAIATGKAFMGEFPVPSPRTVLLIQEESSKAAFKERVKRATNIYGPADNLYLISNRPYNLEDPKGFERLRLEIEAYKPALVILDPLASFVRGNENSQTDMQNFVRTLRDLRNRYDCGFCIVHHSKKSDPTQFRGSSAFYAASEVTVRIVRLDDDVARSKVTFELKDGESPDRMDVQYRQTTGALVPIKASQMLAQALAGGKREDDVHYNR